MSPLRLFVALDLPEPVRDALAALAAAADPARLAPGRAATRSTSRSPSSATARRPTSATIEGLLRAAAPRSPLALAGAEILPPRRGRVLAARIDDPAGALTALQAAAVGAPRRRRPVHARDAAVPRRTPRSPGCARAPARRAPPDLALEPLAFTADAVTLYVSRLHPPAPATSRWRARRSLAG